MTERKWTLKIVDAKSRIRAWSKQKTLYAILVAGLAATMLAPTVALADDITPTTPASETLEATAPEAESVDKQVPAPSGTPAATPAEVAPAAEAPATETPAATTDAPSATPSEPASTEQPVASATDDSRDPAVTPTADAKTPAADEGVTATPKEGEKDAAAPTEAPSSSVTDAKATDITFTRTDDNYEQGTDPKISMTEERQFHVTVGVDGVDKNTLQGMLDRNEVTFWLKRDKGEFDSKEYPYQWLGGKMSDWKTVATKDRGKGINAPSVDFFKNVHAYADIVGGKSAIVLDFGNNLLFGVNGIDVRARALVRSAMYDYVGAYQLVCDLGNGSSVATTVDLRPYDEFHTQEEIDAALPKLEEQARENGIYAKVVTFGKSAEGRDMRAIFVAESEDDLKTYQELKKRMEADPAAVMAELHAGTLKYKVPVFYSNVHADEVVAVDAVM